MCGIVGFTNYNSEFNFEKTSEILKNMNDKLIRRGPDEEGVFKDKNINLAHRRLIVIDPDGGKQPMVCKYQGATYAITYNGQIYNTKELRKELEENGFKFIRT